MCVPEDTLALSGVWLGWCGDLMRRPTVPLLGSFGPKSIRRRTQAEKRAGAAVYRKREDRRIWLSLTPKGWQVQSTKAKEGSDHRGWLRGYAEVTPLQTLACVRPGWGRTCRRTVANYDVVCGCAVGSLACVPQEAVLDPLLVPQAAWVVSVPGLAAFPCARLFGETAGEKAGAHAPPRVLAHTA